ncbi:hypothetical protein SAMN04487819_101262 [Actinopolyspora alba]|uniref:Uncharacterized protein n=1 Tax=Actinopolyspora alba TaxID=673379 RepID=A0A1I1TQ55_9ACTN|nr:hypothetical protein SAMN04487819_101262 [Actinopolyspora alba]
MSALVVIGVFDGCRRFRELNRRHRLDALLSLKTVLFGRFGRGAEEGVPGVVGEGVDGAVGFLESRTPTAVPVSRTSTQLSLATAL